jgi:hypothetical protein
MANEEHRAGSRELALIATLAISFAGYCAYLMAHDGHATAPPAHRDLEHTGVANGGPAPGKAKSSR